MLRLLWRKALKRSAFIDPEALTFEMLMLSIDILYLRFFDKRIEDFISSFFTSKTLANEIPLGHFISMLFIVSFYDKIIPL